MVEWLKEYTQNQKAVSLDPALDTGWSFSALISFEICIVCFKKTKKRPRKAYFKKKNYIDHCLLQFMGIVTTQSLLLRHNS